MLHKYAHKDLLCPHGCKKKAEGRSMRVTISGGLRFCRCISHRSATAGPTTTCRQLAKRLNAAPQSTVLERVLYMPKDCNAASAAGRVVAKVALPVASGEPAGKGRTSHGANSFFFRRRRFSSPWLWSAFGRPWMSETKSDCPYYLVPSDVAPYPIKQSRAPLSGHLAFCSEKA